jgi:hypothetical protein
VESRRVDQDTIEIVGELKPHERERFLARSIVTGLDKERAAGKSLALLKPEIIEFKIESKGEEEIAAERAQFDLLRAQPDLFNTKPMIPLSPCPYRFKYHYRTEDGEREGTCQDWEIEAAYFNWSRRYGDNQAIAYLQKVFGEEFPAKGMLLAMGTHSRYPDRWLINGVVRLDEIKQLSML